MGFKENIPFQFPNPLSAKLSLKDSIIDLQNDASIFDKNNLKNNNNEYSESTFSPIYMSRNRVKRLGRTVFHNPSRI